MESRAIAVILAAGEGKRMKSVLPKVLHRLAGRPLIEYVVQTSLRADMDRTIVVVGHRRDMVIEALQAYPIEFVVQEPQRGTGHALQQVVSHVGRFGGRLVVLLGDAPFVQPETLQTLVERHTQEQSAITLLTAELDDPSGYGRIVRGEDGLVERIVEESDASEEERAIREINSGIGCYSYPPLCEALEVLRSDNHQGEFYLTDTISIVRQRGVRVAAVRAEDAVETWGVNDFRQLRQAERIYRERHAVPEAEEPEPEEEAPAPAGAEGEDQVYHAGGLEEDADDLDGDEGPPRRSFAPGVPESPASDDEESRARSEA